MTIFLSSCSTLDAMLATPIAPSQTETPLPTATINWFPASATPTLQVLSTQPPTPEMRPGIGDEIISDDFSDPSLWNISASNQASADIKNNRLTLSVQSQVFMLSLRQDLILDNYYAEITARPSLCRNEDNYGLLVRASTINYYRFALACNGTVRAERISGGTRLVLQQPLASGDVPPGAPGEVRIGVWAVGKEMRLFLNGRFQFSLIDPSFKNGTLGVFVRAAGNTAAVVSFSDLSIQSVDYIPPTATPLP
ncbi:MAG: hypothetical protein FJZ86_14675 [Chloroflexi bacterium]|nr:hypothetical protein [Chloroflexota bacterium]